MNTLNAIIETIIEIISTILPISSSGHISVVSHLLGDKKFSLLLSIVVRVSMIIPIIIVFRKSFIMFFKETVKILREVTTKKFTLKVTDDNRKVTFLIFIATIFYAIMFFSTISVSKRLETDLDIVVESIFLILTGVIFFFADRKIPGNKIEADLKIYDLALVGILFGLNSIPGLAGNAMVLSYLILRGFNREFAFSISTIMLVPYLILSSIYDVKNLFANETENPNFIGIITAIAITIVLGYFLIKLVQTLLMSDRLNVFSNYLIILGGILLIIGIIEIVLDSTFYGFITNVKTLIE